MDQNIPDNDSVEPEHTWPWLDTVREQDAEATRGMTPEQIVVYYRQQVARLREQLMKESHAEAGNA